jgi:hypothetical protein
MGNRLSGGALKLPVVSGGSNGVMYTIILAICDTFPPTAEEFFEGLAEATTCKPAFQTFRRYLE